jgi:indole-3-acetate monooxygenase
MLRWHAVSSVVQEVGLVYLTGGESSLYATCPLERTIRDVHSITQHIAVHPRLLVNAGVLFGLEPDPTAISQHPSLSADGVTVPFIHVAA